MTFNLQQYLNSRRKRQLLIKYDEDDCVLFDNVDSNFFFYKYSEKDNIICKS